MTSSSMTSCFPYIRIASKSPVRLSPSIQTRMLLEPPGTVICQNLPPVTHKGKMKIDATCTDAEMRYPTDINILEDSSREIERLVQKVSSKVGITRPRSCRGEARSCFVRYTKKKHKGRKLIRETKKLLLHLLSKDVQGFINLLGRVGNDILSVSTIGTCPISWQSVKHMNNRNTCSTMISAPVLTASSASSSLMCVR